MATGGSTNLLIHLIAMAQASGISLAWDDLADISDVVPLMARVYPNGLADVNHFHAAGGLGFMIGQLLNAGLLHDDTLTIMGQGLEAYTREPKIDAENALSWAPGTSKTLNEAILRPVNEPFQATGGLKSLSGSLGDAVIKVSAVKEKYHTIEAPVRVFESQQAVKDAFRDGELEKDVIIVVRYQGPKANGMPELHSLTPPLSVLQGRGFKVALVTDGRMSGASGKVPAAIHVSPEALDGGPIAKLKDGDIVRVDAVSGKLDIVSTGVMEREIVTPDLSANNHGVGRELFGAMRAAVGPAARGASIFTE